MTRPFDQIESHRGRDLWPGIVMRVCGEFQQARHCIAKALHVGICTRGIALAFLLVFAGAAKPAKAATVSTGLSDLILGFRATGGQGSSSNLEVNLGSISQYYSATGSITVTQLSVADLSSVYGAAWSSRLGVDLFWGVVGTTGRTSVGPNGQPSRTLWASVVPSSSGGSTPWPRNPGSAQSSASALIEALYTGSPGSLDAATATATSAASGVVNASAGGSWTVQLGNSGAAFGLFNPATSFDSPGAGFNHTKADIYEMRSSTTGGNGTLLGTFSLSSAGVLSFSPPAVPPAITTQTAAQTIAAGLSVTFSIVATGTPAPTFQWSKDGTPIAGATNASYTIASVQTANAGSYVVTVTNSAGSVTSGAMTLTVPTVATALSDLILGFRASAGQGSASNLEVNLGSISQYSTAAGTITVPRFSVADLVAVFGSNWNTRLGTDLFWGAVGSTGRTTGGPNGQPARTLWATAVQTSGGTTTPWQRSGSSAQGSASALIEALYTGSPGSLDIANSTANSAFAAVVNASLAGSWTTQEGTSGAAFDILNPSTLFDNPGAGANYFKLDLYEMRPNASGGNGTLLGTFALGSNGVLTFIPPAGVAPAITTQPVAQIVTAGESVTFNVVASGSPAPTYQWAKNSVPIAGATNSSYSIANTVAADAGSYAVIVTNSAGSVTSNAVTLSVNVAPTITTQPVAQTVTAGGSVTFAVVATGTPAPTYQWNKAGNPIAGATNSSYTIANAQGSDAANYTVTVTNSAGNVTSVSVALLVNIAPSITAQPVAQTVTAGASASFSVVASGTPAPAYQWRKGGVPISGANAATLTISGAQPADAGSYDVIVSNVVAAVTSQPATLAVNLPPVITTQPASVTITAGLPATLTIVATGTPAPTFQWRKNGINVVGATQASLAFAATAAANAGNYDVVVTNVAGAVTSGVAVLTVNVPPAIASQPTSMAAGIGTGVVLSVAATGTAPLTYQWTKGGVSIPGATSATLSLGGLTMSDSGSYRVVVSNLAGTITSNVATLNVLDAAPTQVVVGRGYVAGGTVTISNLLTFSDATSGLGWQVLLPPGWSYVSGAGNEGDVKPVAGTTDLLEWAWTTIPASPFAFTYALNVPAGTTGVKMLAAIAIVRQPGAVATIIVKPDPLSVNRVTTHTADVNGDNRISLVELTRVIELFNTRNGSTRTGAYKVEATGEDGFASDTLRLGATAATLGAYHSADSDQNGFFSLFELTRVIELYNYRAGTVRTGQYHPLSGTEDGFAPGP